MMALRQCGSVILIYTFAPPTVLEPTGINHPLFGRMRLAVGVTVLKRDALYRQLTFPSAEEIDLSDIAYLGGHEYLVTNEEAASLQAAGYGEWISIPVDPDLPPDPGDDDPDEYGLGAYGTGTYGK